jgi:hypothetical protein
MPTVMRIAVSLLLAAAVAVPSAFAQSGGGGGAEELLEQLRNQDVFCDGTYALCIKAPCSAIPTIDRLGNYAVDYALCSCDLVQGWSMGPGACTDRTPVKKPLKKNGRTYLISTYSNSFNSSEKTLSCPSDTLWAWCYGAPCVVDEKAPNKAVCTCPVQQGAAKTLGGNCQQSACSGIWSAATPAGDAFANQHYQSYMQKNQPSVPVNPPAAACPASGGGGGGW